MSLALNLEGLSALLLEGLSAREESKDTTASPPAVCVINENPRKPQLNSTMKFTHLAATLASVLVLAAADDSSGSLRGSSDFGEQEPDQVRIPAEAAVRVAKKPTKKPTKKP